MPSDFSIFVEGTGLPGAFPVVIGSNYGTLHHKAANGIPGAYILRQVELGNEHIR